jgi:hypothetical protein
VRRPPPLSALTVWQPWAWAIAGGWKQLENRDWPPPAVLIGKWFAIHAGRQHDEEAAAYLEARKEQLGLPGAPPPGGQMTLGAIVAVARVAGAVQVEEVFDDPYGVGRLQARKVLGQLSMLDGSAAAASPWATGPWLWVLRDIVPIAPVPCRGFQRLWTVPDDVAGKVREAYRAARAAGVEVVDG